MTSRLKLHRYLVPLLALVVPLLAVAEDQTLAIRAARIFDGYAMQSDAELVITRGRIVKIGPASAIAPADAKVVDLGDATLLPGFIELHAHLAFQHVPADTVLRHGVTTLRDVGGPLHQPFGGDGRLRFLTSGPIITAPGGYPIPSLGEADIAVAVEGEQQARETVRNLVAGGAVLIKVALEPGGEAGAPWASGHAHSHHDAHSAGHAPAHHGHPTVWPLLPENVVEAIVDEAHKLGRKVSAHIAEEKGAQIALDAGIDEWAHTPCAVLPDRQLQRAAAQGVKIVSTIDTLAKCPGIFDNVQRLSALGVEFLYGAEIAHPDIPWGIDGQELLYLQNLAGMQPLDVLRTATSAAGRYLNIPLLGSLLPGAPADLIAVKGDPTQKLKLLEYPDLVISGGKVIVDNFTGKDGFGEAIEKKPALIVGHF